MAASEIVNLTMVKRDRTFVDRLTPGGRLIRRYIQCGTCSSEE